MAKARQIHKRRKAVTNIRKITRTMQLIATARFRAAFNRAMATKPYTRKLSEMVEELSASATAVDDPLLRDNPQAPADAVVVITSNRGLCGGYNTSVLAAANEHLERVADRPTHVHVVGKKGISYFRFLGREMRERITDIDDRPKFERVEQLARALMNDYRAGRLRSVHIASMRFVSAGKQVAEVVPLLPLSKPGAAVESARGVQRTRQYDFSPAPDVLLARLLPQSIKVRLFQRFTDAAVSEQVARMVAMKSATEAAEEMIKTLTRSYNRARQTQITLELLDIVGGAESLK
ncbi:MAG: ATP synthase F1 subunit gamma [Phycisphaerae bacterium]